MTIEFRDAVTTPPVGEDGDACRSCGAPMAGDQRWCLSCGRRRSEIAAPFGTRERSAPEPVTQAPILIAGRRVPPLAVGGGLAIFLIALLLGVAIGGGDEPRPVAAAAPQVIRVTVPAAAPAAPASFTSDWPAAQEGFTVQLQVLPKDGTEPAQVEQAKADAESKGAPGVGALDTDEFPDLDTGNYLVYAGVFETRKQASKALRGLKGDFPGAKVVKVSTGGGGLAAQGDPGALSGKKKSAAVGKQQLEDLKKLSPEKYQKKSSKLPDETKLPGKAPPKDDKQPGGGGQAEEIG